MLAELAIKKRSIDNITVMIVDLRTPDCTFGKIERGEEKEETKEQDTQVLNEDELKRFDQFLKESIEAIEQNIEKLEQ